MVRFEVKFPLPLVFEKLDTNADVVLFGSLLATFGKAVVVGLGGIYVEVFKTLSCGLCPISEDEARDMVKRSEVSALLSARNRNYDEGSVVSSNHLHFAFDRRP